MRFGCCIRRIDDIPPAKKAGCEYFEFSGAVLADMSDGDFERLLTAARENGLPCCGFNSYCSGSPAIVGDAYSPDAAEEYALRICERGMRLGIRSIGIGAPKARRLPRDYSPERADGQCADFLRTTARIAARYGQLVLFEAVNDKLCDYAVHTSDAVRMVRSLNTANIAIVLDFYHMSMMGESAADAADAVPYLRHVHFSTAGAGLRRGFPQEEDAGEYREIIAWLKAGGYNGTVSIEPTEFDFRAAEGCMAMLKKLDMETERT